MDGVDHATIALSFEVSDAAAPARHTPAFCMHPHYTRQGDFIATVSRLAVEATSDIRDSGLQQLEVLDRYDKLLCDIKEQG